jgi:hypothetical protein
VSSKSEVDVQKLKAYAKSPQSLVAITGLAGQAFVSWQNVKGDMWLRDYLPYDIPSLRVFTYGFQSELWMSTSTATLADYSDIFLDHLRNCLDIGRVRITPLPMHVNRLMYY